VSAFVISRLDYGNATLSALPQSTLASLQRVLNAAARLVCDLRPREHCNQCTNRFTLASYCCTYRIQDNKARISHYEKKLAHLLNVTGILCISSKTSCAKSSAVGLLFFCQSLKPCSRLHLQFCLLAATTFKVKNAMGRYRGQCGTMLIFFKGFLTYCSGTQVVWQNLKSLH